MQSRSGGRGGAARRSAPRPAAADSAQAAPAAAAAAPASQPAKKSETAPAKKAAPPSDSKTATGAAKSSDEPKASAAAAHPSNSSPDDDDDADRSARRSWRQDISARVPLVRRGSFRLYMGGLIQTQAAIWVGNDSALQDGDFADTEGFRVRRARLGFSGQLLPDVKFYLALDLKDAVTAATGGSVGSEILDATVSWNRFSFLQIAAGVDRMPFSGYALRSSGRLTLIDRPFMVNVISPNRRVGVRVYGQLGDLGYAAGVYNGTDGITSGNRLAGLAGAIRLKYDLLGAPREFVPTKLRIQVAAAYVYENGQSTTSHRAAFNLAAQAFRTRLFGEFLWRRSTPDAEPGGDPDAGDATTWGVAGQLSVFVWSEHVEVAGRYEYFRDNNAVLTAGRQQLISGGVNVYLCRNRFKLQGMYMRRDELEGAEIKNDIVFAQLQAMF
ncbi:MAG: hypothetical protein KC503_05810 [Myxococcales bacterium]|nr:hypothetical protein [Myxococcales bacterium]